MLVIVFGLIMIAGILVGSYVPGIPQESRFRQRLQQVMLYGLLFILGYQLGGNEDIVASMSRMGLVGVALAVVTMTASFAAVWFLRTLFDRRIKENADD